VAQVIVVGAGPVGLAVAHGLSLGGVDCRVLDRSAGPPTGSRCPILWPATLHALVTLGLPVAALADRAVPVRRKVFHLAGDSFGHGLDDPAGPWPVPLSAGQDVLEAVLRDALARRGVAVEYGTRVAAVTDDGDGVLVDVAGGGRSRLRAEYLVLALGDSAEGAALAGVDRTVRAFAPLRAIAADASLSRPPADASAGRLPADEEHIFLGDGAQVGFVPMPGGRHRVSVTFSAGDDGLAAVRRLTGVQPRWLDEPWLVEPASALAATFHNGRLVLVGESAKTVAQRTHGLNSGLQDAANLAWKLAAVVRGAADPRLLHTYTAERHAVARSLLERTERVLQHAASGPALRARVRERRHDLRTQPEVSYAGGPLTGRSDFPDTPAGAPLPQANVVCDGRVMRLYDVLALGRWTALVRAPRSAAHPEVVVRAVTPAPGEAELPELCLVRPDGYVAMAGAVSEVDTLLDSAGYAAALHR